MEVYPDNYAFKTSYYVFYRLGSAYKSKFTVKTQLVGTSQNLSMGFSNKTFTEGNTDMRNINAGTVVSPKTYDYTGADDVYVYFANGDGLSNSLEEISLILQNYNILVELGEVAGNYIVHQGVDVDFSLSGSLALNQAVNYKDKIINKDGVWYKKIETRKLELTVSEMNNYEAYPGWKGLTQFKTDYPNSAGSLAYITDFSCNITAENSLAIGVNNRGDGVIFLKSEYFDNLTQSQWIEQYPNLVVTIYYGLKHPEYTEITDVSLIRKLDSLQNLLLYEGINYVHSNSVINPILKIKYCKYSEDFDAYISSDGYLNIPDYDIKYLVDFMESSIPSMPEASESSVRVAGRDGDIPLMTTYEPMSFEVVCYTEDNLSVEEKSNEEKKINKFLNTIKNNTRTFSVEKNDKFYNVKYNGNLTTTNYPKHLKFSIPLKSSNSYGMSFQKSEIKGSAVFESETIEDAGAIFTIYGPATNPIISLNGYQMKYEGSVISGSKLVIDSRNSTITLVTSAGVKTNAMRYYNHQFPKIQNGGNTFLIQSGISNESQATIEWYDLKL